MAIGLGRLIWRASGFEAPQWSMRLSLANLPDEVYEDIGRGVRTVARGYRDAFEDSVSNLTGGGPLLGRWRC